LSVYGFARYALAVVAVVIGILLRVLLVEQVGELPTFITFYPAVMIAAVIGGLGPGLLATALAALAADYWFISPPGFGEVSAAGAVALGLFSAMGVLMSLVAALYASARFKVAAYAKEVQLHESEERFRLFMDNSPTIAWVKDEMGCYIYLSRAFEKRFGARLADWYGKTDAELWLPEIAAEFRANDLAVLAAGQPMQVTEETLTSDGERCSWLTTKFPFCDAAGHRFVAGIGLDITEHKAAQEALRQSREDLDRAQEVGQIGWWRMDTQRNVLTWSNESYRIFGIPLGTPLTYETFLETVHPEERACVDARWIASLRGEPYDIEHRIIARGQVKWVREKAYLEFDTEGKLLGGFGITQDITERKHAEEALRQAKMQLEQRVAERTQELQQALEQLKNEFVVREKIERESERLRHELAHVSRMATMGELTSALAHELKQPLAAILYNAQAAQRLLASDSMQVEEMQEILQDIVDDDVRARDVIDRLRTFTRKDELTKVPVNLNDLIGESVKLLYQEFLIRGVSIETHLCPELPAASGDRVQLQQVMLNLTFNAADAMAGRSDGERKILISTALDNPTTVRVSITDNGDGIDPDLLAQIFEPFHTTKPQGMGMGLAICRTIISAHNGGLWAENNSGCGATFHITLPVAEESIGAGVN